MDVIVTYCVDQNRLFPRLLEPLLQALHHRARSVQVIRISLQTRSSVCRSRTAHSSRCTDNGENHVRLRGGVPHCMRIRVRSHDYVDSKFLEFLCLLLRAHDGDDVEARGVGVFQQTFKDCAADVACERGMFLLTGTWRVW